ncbi:hypothetical protein PS420_07980 [Pediococcus acidilactici]
MIYAIYAIFRKSQAVVPLFLFKRRNFTGSMIGLVWAGIVNNGPMLLLPLFFQNLRGQNVAEAGLSLIPQGIRMLIVGLLVTLIRTVPFMSFDQHANFWLLMGILFVRGIGAGAIISPLMTDSFVGQDPKYSGQISIAGRITQNVGGAFGSALMATVVSAYLTSHTHELMTNHLTTVAHAYQQGVYLGGGLHCRHDYPNVLAD